MKESGKERLKSTIYESTLSTADAVPLPQWGRRFLLSGEAATFIPNSLFNSLPVSLRRAAGFQGR